LLLTGLVVHWTERRLALLIFGEGMLTAEEITAAVVKTLREMKETYPLPYPALDLARNLQEYKDKQGINVFPNLVQALLPAGWYEWFLHLWMAKTLEVYGVQVCQEYIAHEQELLVHDQNSNLTGWRCPITVQKLALCEKFWFPRQQAVGGER